MARQLKCLIVLPPGWKIPSYHFLGKKPMLSYNNIWIRIKINTLYDVPLHYKGDPFALVRLSLLELLLLWTTPSGIKMELVCRLTSLTCPACGVTRVAWSTTKIQLTSGTASLHRHRTAICGCAVDCCCAMSSRKDIWDLAKQHMAGVYDYNFSWPTKISCLCQVSITPL